MVEAVVWALGLVVAFGVLILIFDIILGAMYGLAWVMEYIGRRWNRDERSR